VAEKPIEPSERLRCLHCGSAGPFASCVILRDYALREGQIISEPSGDRVACQRCGGQFSMHRDGSFQHHAQAEPYTGEARAIAGIPLQQGVTDIERPAPDLRPLPPMARQRPSV